MASKREIFNLSGPHHLIKPNWLDADHRRCIATSFVQGVYVRERDRQQQRLGLNAQAEIWWRYFNFKLIDCLIDGTDGSIFGAVYKWNQKLTRPPGAPNMVVAFRGTLPSVAGDLWMNYNLLTNRLHTTRRLQTALEAVKICVHKHGCENVWVAGHSLGAAVAMSAGRKLAEEERVFLQAHLFNPPFISPVERIGDENLKRGFHLASSLVTAGLAMALQNSRARNESYKSFCNLQSWVPCLYINPRDEVCSGYLGYFESQKLMNQIGAEGIARFGAQQSIADIFLTAMGQESKTGHLIPSARFTVNLNPAEDFRMAHGMQQWWAPDLRIKCTEFRLHPVRALHSVQAPARGFTGHRKPPMVLKCQRPCRVT
ncbi:hypothetical protein SUGI_0709910 [Cryptomeria japonica]|uniref:GDSL esterase/lipase At4g10955 n=1 Tax=Cryptomeria japonica TaxID=3369 RepID=UPI002414810B|nr:GDSL esterase/lipase At4g10955 [Cryptomeria japonica]GLJ35280.1 hypothetical protein SUGI_0709910 [Cryptomeria japonica]